MLGAPYAAFVSHGLAAEDRSALRVNVTRISGNETTTAARNGFAAHRFPSLSGMSTKQAARRDNPTAIDGRRPASKSCLRRAAYRRAPPPLQEGPALITSALIWSRVAHIFCKELMEGARWRPLLL